MSEPVSSYTVSTVDSATPVTVSAQYFTTADGGTLVFFNERNQPVAAFPAGHWINVQPVVTL